MEHDNQKFYDWFLKTTSDLESQISQLEASTSRQKDIDKIQGEIANLTKSLADASDKLPTYDLKSYNTTIKSLTEKLDRASEKVAPRSRFQFKSRAKTGAQAEADTRRLNVGQGQDVTPSGSAQAAPAVSSADAAATLLQQVGQQKDYDAEIKASRSPVRKPSFSSAKTINLRGHSASHIVLPGSASTATSAGSLQDVDGCVVDMSLPATVAPFAGLALQNIRKSVVVTGSVAGPVHMTGVTDSVLVISSRQVRIHECKNVDIYLHCTSHPIIEDCAGMRFAPVPQQYWPPWGDSTQNQWGQVDDFKWLKVDHSPNWKIMPEADRIADAFWADQVASDASGGVAALLEKAGIRS